MSFFCQVFRKPVKTWCYTSVVVRRNIRDKLLLSYLAVLLVPIATLGIVSPLIYGQRVEQLTLNSSSELIRQVDRNVDQVFLKMDELIQMASRYPPIAAFLSGADSTFAREQEIRVFLRACKDSHPELAGILVLDARDRMIGLDFTRITRDPLLWEPWFLQAADSPRKLIILARPIGRNLRSPKTLGDNVVSLIKAIPSKDGRGLPGVVLLDVNLNAIVQLFHQVGEEGAGFLFLVDSNGEVVYAPSNPIAYRIPAAFFRSGQRNGVFRIDGQDYSVSAAPSSYTGLSTVAVYSQGAVLKDVRLLGFFAWILGGLAMTTAAAIAFLVSASIARPVVRLRSLMEEAEHGNLGVRFPEKSMDEIGLLGKSFNTMLSRIADLIQNVYEEQRQKRDAEFRVLQAQIKPHFLYNTLDTIHWMAQAKGAEDIVGIVEALTTLFRISLNKGKEIVPLKSEIEHVKSYLVIQKIRYRNKLEYDISCEKDLDQLSVLKLTLQPLVENAIYHGIKERPGPGRVSIRIQKKDSELLMTVEDDGVGMDEAALIKLRDNLHGGVDTSVSGFGTYSVHQRICLAFGDNWGLTIESRPGDGTTVTVRQPVVEVLVSESEDR